MNGDDDGHSQIGESLFRKVLVERRFLSLAEEGLDDGNGGLEIALSGDQPPVLQETVVEQMEERRDDKDHGGDIVDQTER